MANLNLGKTKIISDKNNTFFTNNKIMTGTEIPTSGDYVKGDMIVNIGSTSASEPIWICNVSGNPGQWSVLGIGTVGSGGSGSTTIVSADVVCIQDIVTVDNAVSEVSLEGLGVNISTDDKLMVHFNSVYLMEGVDYNIDYTNNKITVIGDEPWNNSGIEGSVFSLELFRNVQDTEGSVIQARFENDQNLVTLEGVVNEIPIGIDGFDKNNNLLLVFKNTLHLAEGIDYSISDDSTKIININSDWEWKEGDNFVFIILRVVPNIDMPTGSINGGAIADGSITVDKLGEDVQEAIRNAAASGGSGSSSKLVKLENNVVLENDSNEVEICISNFNKDNDTILVFKNALHLIEDIDFSINDDSSKIINVDPNIWEWDAGDEFSFTVFKNVSEVDGDLIEVQVEYINASLVKYENVVTVDNAVSEVEIGIEEFDKEKDTMMVFKNSTHMTEGVDYSISDDSSKIIPIGENWNLDNLEGFEFSFIVFKNVADSAIENSLAGTVIKDGTITVDKLGEDVQEAIENAAANGGSGKMTCVQNVVTIDSAASEVEIGISGYDKNSDTLMVFKNSVHIAENVEYTISDDSSKIVKMDGNWNEDGESGFGFVFIVFKYVVESDIENSLAGTVIKDGTITVDKLDEDVQEVIENASNMDSKYATKDHTHSLEELGAADASDVGDLSNLQTVSKGNLVSAILLS